MQKNRFISFWKQKASGLQLDTYALYLAYRDPRVPWYARVWIVVVLAYAFSPIDLIPDFIPVLGYLDDLILIPLGVLVALRMIPSQVMQECREKARASQLADEPSFKWMGAVVIAIWVLVLLAIGIWLARKFLNWP